MKYTLSILAVGALSLTFNSIELKAEEVSNENSNRKIVTHAEFVQEFGEHYRAQKTAEEIAQVEAQKAANELARQERFMRRSSRDR